MPRVLVSSLNVAPAPDRHGVELLRVLRALASRHEVDALTLKVEDLSYVERIGRTRMLRVPVGGGTLGEQVNLFRRAVRRQLEGAEYDVVHVRSAFEGRPVCEARRELGFRVVLELARSIEGGPRPRDPALAAAWADDEAYCLARADLVLVPTEAARLALRARGLAAPVEVVPPGVDVDLFDEEIAEPAGDGDPVVLCAGTIAPGRGLRLLIAAMERLIARTPARLLLVGAIEPGFENELHATLARSSLGPRCVLRAAVAHEDLPRVLAGAAVCVAPATAEAAERPLAGPPTKLFEYMACGLATIAPRSPYLAEAFEDGKETLLFPRGDVAALAGAIGRLLTDPALRRRIAEHGYQAVRMRHAASATRRRLLEAYRHVLPVGEWRPVADGARSLGGAPSDPNTTTAQRLRVADRGTGSFSLLADGAAAITGATFALGSDDPPPAPPGDGEAYDAFEVGPTVVNLRRPVEATGPALAATAETWHVGEGVPLSSSSVQIAEAALDEPEFAAIGTLLGLDETDDGHEPTHPKIRPPSAE